MASLFHLTVILCFAVVHCRIALFSGKCPDIPSKVTEEKNENEENIKWYSLYGTYPDIDTYHCVSNTVSKINSTVTRVASILYNSTGQKIEMKTDMEKTATEGKFKFTFFCEEVNETVTSDVSTVHEGPNCLMSWTCVDFNNGTYTEGATILSSEKSIPEEHVKMYEKYLKDHGSQAFEFKKISQENCPE